MGLEVDLPPPTASGSNLSDGIRGLYQKCQFYDIVLIVGEKRFPAHQAVIASMGPKLAAELREAISLRTAAAQLPEGGLQTGGPEAEGPAPGAIAAEQKSVSRYLEVPLKNIENPEAAQALLDYIYGLGGEYCVSSDEVNQDVLRLAQHYELKGLEALAERRLSDNVSTDNVVARLSSCHEFNLSGLFDLLSDELITNPVALQMVSVQMEVMKYPEILQKLLIRASEHYNQGEERSTSSAPSTGNRKRAAPVTNEKRSEKAAKANGGAAVVGGA